jgi:hypothetical protein
MTDESHTKRAIARRYADQILYRFQHGVMTLF